MKLRSRNNLDKIDWLTLQDLYCRPQCTTAVCFQIAENELMITQLSSKLKRQTGQSQFFTEKKTENQTVQIGLWIHSLDLLHKPK